MRRLPTVRRAAGALSVLARRGADTEGSGTGVGDSVCSIPFSEDRMVLGL